jgi:amino acid adenylation domain-containing protein
LLKLIKNSFEKFSERNAVNINGTYYTYFEFSKFISKVRAYIDSNCSSSEKLVGIIARESTDIETYSSIYGALFAGKGYVPINPANPLERNSSIIFQSEIKTIFCKNRDEKVESISKVTNAKIVYLDELKDEPINLTLPVVDDNEVAYVLFTSGSTGIPKGVPITRKNLSSFVEAFLALDYKVDENDRFLQMFELTFDFSVVCYTVPLCIGACFYTVPAEGVKFANVYMVMEENEITFACLVPSVLSYLKPYFAEIRLEKIKYSLFCGETLYQDIAKLWSACIPNGTIINAYGPTEATVFCLTFDWNKFGSDKKTFNGGVCIGKPMKNIKAIIVDENLIPIPKNSLKKGELCLCGSQLTPGYWKNPEKNNEAFFKINLDGIEEIYYRTGDLAFIDEDGDFMFAGRIDSQIKIQGFRIELGEIEHFARECASNNNVAAIAYQNSLGTMNIHLFVENYEGSLSKIINYLKTKVPEYMIPSGVSSLPFFPLNANGKTDRKELLKIIQNQNNRH